MAASPRRINPLQRDAIYRARKAGMSGRAISEKAKAGALFDLPAFNVAEQTARDIGQAEMADRGELYRTNLHRIPATEATAALARRLIVIAERETDRLDRQQLAGKLQATHLSSLAIAVKNLDSLAHRIPSVPAQTPDSNGAKAQSGAETAAEPGAGSFLDELRGDQAPGQDPEPTPPATVADVVVGVKGGVTGPRPRSSAPVASGQHDAGTEGGAGPEGVARTEGVEGAGHGRGQGGSPSVAPTARGSEASTAQA